MLLLEHISTTAVVDHLRVKISPAVAADRLLVKSSTAKLSKPLGRKKLQESVRRKRTLGKRKL